MLTYRPKQILIRFFFKADDLDEPGQQVQNSQQKSISHPPMSNWLWLINLLHSKITNASSLVESRFL